MRVVRCKQIPFVGYPLLRGGVVKVEGPVRDHGRARKGTPVVKKEQTCESGPSWTPVAAWRGRYRPAGNSQKPQFTKPR